MVRGKAKDVQPVGSIAEDGQSLSHIFNTQL
jgi:hypothetical protein